jgi:hypothetical protein
MPTVVNQAVTYGLGTGETTAALFINSPIVITNGLATAVGTANTSDITGTIVAMRDTYGRSVCNKPSSTADYEVEYTYDPGQLYICTVAGTAFTGDTMAEDFWTLEAESATANADPELGDSTSKRQLATASSSAGPIQVIARYPKDDVNNAVATDGTQVICKINPARYVSRS